MHPPRLQSSKANPDLQSLEREMFACTQVRFCYSAIHVSVSRDSERCERCEKSQSEAQRRPANNPFLRAGAAQVQHRRRRRRLRQDNPRGWTKRADSVHAAAGPPRENHAAETQKQRSRRTTVGTASRAERLICSTPARVSDNSSLLVAC